MCFWVKSPIFCEYCRFHSAKYTHLAQSSFKPPQIN